MPETPTVLLFAAFAGLLVSILALATAIWKGGMMMGQIGIRMENLGIRMETLGDAQERTTTQLSALEGRVTRLELGHVR